MRDIDGAALAAIGRGDYAHNWLLLFDFPSGLYGFHFGQGKWTFNGIDYVGAGSALSLEQIEAGTELSASPIVARMRAVPDIGLTPDVLSSVDAEAYKNRPVTLSLVYFNKQTGGVAHLFSWWRGFVDTIEHDETVGGTYELVARLEPRSLDHSRNGYRMRSDTDQRLIDPEDRFFEHAATTPFEELPYGRNAKMQPINRGGSDTRTVGG